MKFPSICIAVVACIIFFAGCKKKSTENVTAPRLIFKFVFDSTQARLNDFGQMDSIPANHAGQSPQINVMSAHYIELSRNANTPLGSGLVLYKTSMTTAGGASAIDFEKEVLTANDSVFYSVALDSVTPGTYQYLRVSLAYQNYGVQMYVDTTIIYQSDSILVQQEFPCTIASFVGVNTYVTSYKVKTETISPDSNCAQGYWGFEAEGTYNGNYLGFPFSYPYNFIESGETPAGSTTVVNPLFATSPIPAGSCVATGQFVTSGGVMSSLTVTGHETKDIVILVSLSTNKSFEWVEIVKDGKWQPGIGENIVNMGIRGLLPIISQ